MSCCKALLIIPSLLGVLFHEICHLLVALPVQSLGRPEKVSSITFCLCNGSWALHPPEFMLVLRLVASHCLAAIQMSSLVTEGKSGRTDSYLAA